MSPSRSAGAALNVPPPEPTVTAGLPPEELEEARRALDGPFVPLDLDDFDRWAKTGEGDPWNHGA